MDGNNDQKDRKKTDWSLAESILTTDEAPSTVRDQVARSVDQGELVPTKESGLPAAPAIGVPDTGAGRGIMTKWKENKLGRKATLQALEVHYNSQLDALTHSLTKAVQVQKARADVIAEEYLKELDARQLEMLAELGLRNKDTRERALLKLTDTTAARVKEVQEKDWPQQLIADTMQELFKLRKRVVAEMMKELGGDYTND
ncbi:MAG TPA: hypothetical protein VGN90_06540 [Pyrinomonadaceae bacterium]|jgi:hypothetical protein|nr:hypothetical protein [Pyrinomonadaceae bacterium]